MDGYRPVSGRLLAQRILRQLERVKVPEWSKELQMLRQLLQQAERGEDCPMARLLMATYQASSDWLLAMIQQSQPAQPVRRRRGSGKRRKIGMYQDPPEKSSS